MTISITSLQKALPGTQASDKAIDPSVTQEVRAKLRESATEFQSILYGMMLKSMRDSVDKSGLIDGGNAESIYQSMLDQEYAKVLAEKDNSPLVEAMVDQLSGTTANSKINQDIDKLRGQGAYQSATLQMGPKE